MGMVGCQASQQMKPMSFSPMHGDGWMADDIDRAGERFFPYAWGWLDARRVSR